MTTGSQTTLIRAQALTGFADLVLKQGGDPEALMRQFDIDPERLKHPDNALNLASVSRLCDYTATTLNMPDFGLRMSQRQDISVIGSVAMIVLNSATIGDALAAIARNIQYHTPGASLTLGAGRRPGYSQFQYDLSLPEEVPRRHVMELSYAVVYRFLRLTTGSTGEDWTVDFRHRRGLSNKAYQNYFACPVSFDNSVDSLSFPASLLDKPIDQANPDNRNTAERFLRHMRLRHPLDMQRQVLELIQANLGTGGIGIEFIAQLIGVSPRTLQRKLKVHRVHFEDLIDDVRKRRAVEYLGYGSIPLTQIALLLGYSGQSPFTVACKRWFGVTPKVYRKRLVEGAWTGNCR